MHTYAAYKVGLCPSFQGGMGEPVEIIAENGAACLDLMEYVYAEIEIRNAPHQYDSTYKDGQKGRP